MTNGFVANDDNAFGQNVFDVTKTLSKAVIKPKSMTDDLGRLAIATISIWCVFIIRLCHNQPESR